MKSIAELRKYQYDYHDKVFPYLSKWRLSPYSRFKAILYMEASAILVWFLQRTNVTPNALTVTYGVLGLVGGIFLAMSAKGAIIIAVLIFFLKGILDWSDGHLARLKNQTSAAGAILDGYGGILGAMGLQIGLGFYVAEKSSMMIFYYLIPLIPLFFLGKLHNFALSELFKEYMTKDKLSEYAAKEQPAQEDRQFTSIKSLANPRLEKMRTTINSLLDNRARTVDFICLLLLIELFIFLFASQFISFS